MTGTGPTERAEVCLASLGGRAAPASVVEGWKAFQSLPEPALQAIWDILSPALAQLAPEALARPASEFCGKHGVHPLVLGAAIETCRFLLNRSVGSKLDATAFENDLELLCPGDDRRGIAILTSHYSEISPALRLQILEGSLLDHGKVLADADWRIDTLGSSNRGAGLDFPVALLTLRFKEGYGAQATEDKLSLYLTPQVVRELKALCDNLDSALTQRLRAHARSRPPAAEPESTEVSPPD